ncbi:MAG TPA: hypothetical protein VHT94_03405, partial [Streptosporangiaceae bacterium]|nr:hypothetical protein [Streptosporangiaceae bacterium]
GELLTASQRAGVIGRKLPWRGRIATFDRPDQRDCGRVDLVQVPVLRQRRLMTVTSVNVVRPGGAARRWQ